MTLQRSIREMIEEQADAYADQLAAIAADEPPIMGDLRRTLADSRTVLREAEAAIAGTDEILTSAGYRIKPSRNGPRRVPRAVPDDPPETCEVCERAVAAGVHHIHDERPVDTSEHWVDMLPPPGVERDYRRPLPRSPADAFELTWKPLGWTLATPADVEKWRATREAAVRADQLARRQKAWIAAQASFSGPWTPQGEGRLRSLWAAIWRGVRWRSKPEPSTPVAADDPNVKYAGPEGCARFRAEVMERIAGYPALHETITGIKKQLDASHDIMLR